MERKWNTMQQERQPGRRPPQNGAPRAPQNGAPRQPLTPEQAARRRRKRQEQRKKALRRYYTFLACMGLLIVIAVLGLVTFIKEVITGAGDGESSSSVSAGSSMSAGGSASAASASAAPLSTPEPEPEPEPEQDPNALADPTLWSLILTNVSHPLPEGYTPELASVGSNSRNGTQYMDERVADAMAQMIAAAKADGIELVVRSAYRSTAEQTTLFNSMKQSYLNQGMTEEQALAETKKWRNVPGTSEHETGLSADIVGAADLNADLVPELSERDWAVWLKAHAADYGFILRYPSDKTGITGTSFEPWHYRYVGVEDAKKIMAQGISLEEYLGAAG